MHERISIHQMCFGGTGLSDYVRACRRLGARRIGFIGPALLAPGGLDEARAALAGGDIAVETIAHVFRAGHLAADRSAWRASPCSLMATACGPPSMRPSSVAWMICASPSCSISVTVAP